VNINNDQIMSLLTPLIDNIKAFKLAPPEKKSVELLKLMHSIQQMKTTGADNGKTT